MNRVQQAPAESKAIHAILYRCQQRIGSWVGSAVRARLSLLPALPDTKLPGSHMPP